MSADDVLNSDEWKAFLAGLPEATRELAIALPPNTYRLKTTGQKVWTRSYVDGVDGAPPTMSVSIHHAENPGRWQTLVMGDGAGFIVYGIKREDLEPWDGGDVAQAPGVGERAFIAALERLPPTERLEAVRRVMKPEDLERTLDEAFEADPNPEEGAPW